MKNKGFVVGVIAWLILLAVDATITLLIPYHQYLESNPLYQFGGIPLIIVLNLGILVWLRHFYLKGKPFGRFFCLNVLVAVNITRIFAIIKNIQIYLNPPTLQEAMTVTQTMKTANLYWLVGLNLLPFLITAFTFILYWLDHKIKLK